MMLRLRAARVGDAPLPDESETTLCWRWADIPFALRELIEEGWHVLVSEFAMQRHGHMFCLRCLRPPAAEAYMNVDEFISDLTRVFLHTDHGDDLTFPDVIRCPQMLSVDNGGVGNVTCHVCEADLTLFNPVIDLLESCQEVRQLTKKLESVVGRPLRARVIPSPRRDFIGESPCVCGGFGDKKCSGCLTVRYCSEACQSNHWKAHKRHCHYLRSLTRGRRVK